jgi:hypothetical protein
MVFRHETNSHQKIERNNPGLLAPLFYFKDLKYEKIESVGSMVESFISKDEVDYNLSRSVVPNIE